jgi:anti-sigma factor RsiW
MSHTNDCGGDVAAYVLGALDPEEVEAFREHLDSCVVCRDELAALREAADALPMSTPQYPVPRGLRRRVLDEVRADAKAASRERRPRRRLGVVSRPELAGAAALVVALCVAGGVELASSGGSGAVRLFAATVGHAELRVADGRADLIVHRLPIPPADRIYEVWLFMKSCKTAPDYGVRVFTVAEFGTGFGSQI